MARVSHQPESSTATLSKGKDSTTVAQLQEHISHQKSEGNSAQLGITVFIGVLLDTLIVRTVLVPALVQILGEKFWWPAHLKRAATDSASAQAATPRE